MFCGNMKPALRSLDFLDASPRSHTVLGLLSVLGLSALEGGGAILHLGHTRTQNTAQTPALSPDLPHPGKLEGLQPGRPRGKVPISPRGFERLYPAFCGLRAARPPLASPRPKPPRPGAAGSAQPSTPSLAGPERIPAAWGSCSRPGCSLASWPSSLRCPRSGQSPLGLREETQGTPLAGNSLSLGARS